PDRHVVTGVGDLVEPGDAADIHDHVRGQEPQLHHGDEAHASRHHLGELGAGERRHRLVEAGSGDVLELPWIHQPFLPLCASWIACHTRFGRSGMSMCLTPSGRNASTTALTIVWAEAIVPASPMPFTPSGLASLGVTVLLSSKLGRSAAVGSG